MAEKEAAKKLMNELKAIEDQILQFEAILKANNIGMDEPLTDEQDFPLPNINHYAVRDARGKIRCLLNDKKNKMAEIEQILAQIHQSKGEQEGKAGQDSAEEEVHRTSNRPFVQVEKVQPNSPAQNAGLCDGDLIVQFGRIHADIFKRLDELKDLVMASVDKPIRITVLRNIRVHRLELVPKKWSGNGLIGCGFTKVEEDNNK